MKRFLCIFLSVLTVFSFAVSLSASAEADEIPGQIVIRFQNESRVFFDPNEGLNAILSFSCENPYVVMEENPSAAETINTVLASYNSSYLPSDDGVGLNMDRETFLLSLAEDYYALHAEKEDRDSFLFSFSHRCSVVRCDEHLLALAFTDYLDDIEHTAITSDLFYFDPSTGCQLSEKEAAEQADSTEAVPSGSGECGIFSEEKFASEAFSFGGMSSDSFAVTDLLENDSFGDSCFLCFSGEAADVRLSSVIYYDQWYEKQQLWYCSRMNNEALQLMISQPTPDSTIKLTYHSGGQSFEKLLWLDPSGELFLSDPIKVN